MVYCVRVLQHRQLGRAHQRVAQLQQGRFRVGQQAALVVRVRPGPGHHPRPVHRRARLLEVDEPLHLAPVDDALLGQQLLHGEDPPGPLAQLDVLQHPLMLMAVVGVVVMGVRAHALPPSLDCASTGSSQCSYTSTSSLSPEGPLYRSPHRSFMSNATR